MREKKEKWTRIITEWYPRKSKEVEEDSQSDGRRLEPSSWTRLVMHSKGQKQMEILRRGFCPKTSCLEERYAECR